MWEILAFCVARFGLGGELWTSRPLQINAVLVKCAVVSLLPPSCVRMHPALDQIFADK